MIQGTSQRSTAEVSKDDWLTREVWLGPYIGTRAVTDEQIDKALADGLTVSEIHDRLLDAECCLVALDWDAYGIGWLAATNDIANVDYSAEDPETIGDLAQQAEERVGELRCQCYASTLNGIDWQGLTNISHWRGRADCCEYGCRYIQVDDHITDFDLAMMLRTHTGPQQMRPLIAEAEHQRVDRQILDACDLAMLGGAL
jgi:hypothetical protein